MFSYHLFCTNYDYCRKFVDYFRNCRFSLKLYKKQKKQPTEVFCKKRYSQKFLKIHRKHLCQSTFFNKVADLACNFVKKILWHSCFEFCEISKNTYLFLQNSSGRLLLTDSVFYILSSTSITFPIFLMKISDND